MAQEKYMAPGSSASDYRNALMNSRGIRPTRAAPKAASTAKKPAKTTSTQAKPSSRPAPSGVYSPDASTADSADGGVSVQIYFAYDSDTLTSDAKAELDKLGKALASPDFSQDHWYIEGHTDASGSATYNQVLSTKRAASVRRYLVERHQIKRDLLMAVGKGETELYDANKPNSNINRRVRVKHAGQ